MLAGQREGRRCGAECPRTALGAQFPVAEFPVADTTVAGFPETGSYREKIVARIWLGGLIGRSFFFSPVRPTQNTPTAFELHLFDVGLHLRHALFHSRNGASE